MITMTRTGYTGENHITISPKLQAGMIQPAVEDTSTELATDRAAEPIKKISDINAICEYLKCEGRWRDYMLFVVGINFGLRVSDLRMLRFSDLITDNLQFKETFPVFEKKTRNTRKRKKNRYITINKAVMDAVCLYLDHTPNVTLSDYMFRSISPNGKDENKPLTTRNIDRLLKSMAEAAGVTAKVSTHTLRKTFGYHQMVVSGNDPRKLLLLQKMFGHSTSAQTLEYIGITQDEIVDAYKGLNLGISSSPITETKIIEREEQVVQERTG